MIIMQHRFEYAAAVWSSGNMKHKGKLGIIGGAASRELFISLEQQSEESNGQTTAE